MARIVAIVMLMFVMFAPCGAAAQVAIKDSTSHNFGEITTKQSVSHTFIIENKGAEPLVVIDSKSSCDCIKVSIPSAPIMGGKSGEIRVDYKAGRRDRGTFSKVIEILTSSESSRLLLTISGEVVD